MKKVVKKLNKRQDAILKLINESDSLSVADIFKSIQKDFGDISRITVIRDISALTKDKYLIRSGAGPAVRYSPAPHYNLIKEVDVEKYFAVPQDSRSIKDGFDFSIFDLLKGDVFTDKEYATLQSLMKEFQKNFSKIKSPTMQAKEYERILIEFSWKSSQIEGNTYSLLDTEVLIKENKSAEGKTQEETQMILNQKNAFSTVLKNKNTFKTLSRAKIENLHTMLTDRLNITRNLRSTPVGITGTNYKPLDNTHQIKEAVEKMITLVNKKKNNIEKAFLSLALLSYIQAFEDGNKRTARLCANAILLAHSIIPLSYRAVEEVEYKKATILFYETNNLSYLKTIFIQQFEFAVKNYFN